jgi:hypothetical protein
VNPGTVNFTITAGPLTDTGNTIGSIGRQLRMDGIGADFNHIYITPEVAQQWLTILEPIAKADS